MASRFGALVPVGGLILLSCGGDDSSDDEVKPEVTSEEVDMTGDDVDEAMRELIRQPARRIGGAALACSPGHGSRWPPSSRHPRRQRGLPGDTRQTGGGSTMHRWATRCSRSRPTTRRRRGQMMTGPTGGRTAMRIERYPLAGVVWRGDAAHARSSTAPDRAGVRSHDRSVPLGAGPRSVRAHPPDKNRALISRTSSRSSAGTNPTTWRPRYLR